MCLREQHAPCQEVLLGPTWPVSEVAQLSIQDVRLGFRDAKTTGEKPHTAGPVLERDDSAMGKAWVCSSPHLCRLRTSSTWRSLHVLQFLRQRLIAQLRAAMYITLGFALTV